VRLGGVQFAGTQRLLAVSHLGLAMSMLACWRSRSWAAASACATPSSAGW